MIAWALTYGLHSALLAGAAAALTRTPWGRAARARDAIWKCALAGGLLTATLQQAIGGPTLLAVPIRLEQTRAAVDVAFDPARGDGPGVFRADVSRLALMWAATSGLAALRLGRGWMRVRRAAGRRRVLRSGPLRRELDRILHDAGVTRRLTLSCSRGLTVPRAIGLGEICVPTRVLRDLSASEQRALLAHETAHLLRHDGVWLFVAALLQTVAWWQPLTRVAAARMRHAMELCCDDWAVSRLSDRMALAECLVKVGEWSVVMPPGIPVAAFAVHGSALRERVERLIDAAPAGNRGSRGRWLAAVLLLGVLALAPRVTVAVARSAAPAAVAPPAAVESPRAIATAADPPPAVKERRRAQRPLPPAEPAPKPSDGSTGASPIGEPVGAMPASEVTPFITMPEALLRPSPSPLSAGVTRAAIAAARRAPARTAPAPLVVSDALSRRVGAWLEFQRRTPSFDPLSPKY